MRAMRAMRVMDARRGGYEGYPRQAAWTDPALRKRCVDVCWAGNDEVRLKADSRAGAMCTT